MDLEKLDNRMIVAHTKKLVANERKCTAEVLRYLQAIYNRRIHLEMSYPSIFEFVVKELGYSHSAAKRRVSALKLAQDLPSITEKVESGELSLATIAKVNSFIYAEKKSGREIKTEEKETILQQAMKSENPRNLEKLLILMSSTPVRRQEKIRAASNNETMLQIYIKEEVFQKLERAKTIFKAQSNVEILEKMLDFCLKHKDPLEKASRTKLKEEKTAQKKRATTVRRQRDAISHEGIAEDIYVDMSEEMYIAQKILVKDSKITDTPNCAKKSRYITAAVKHKVWLRDQNRCTYVDSQSGKRCVAAKNLELDHRRPFALGGSNSAENLRLLCRNHNQYLAIKTYSEGYIQKKIVKSLPNNGRALK